LIKIKIGSQLISETSSPYVIAEIGVNHECSLSLAKKLMWKAKIGGANAVKFQTYKADLITSKNSPAYWDKKKEKTKSQYELFKKYDLFNFSDYLELYRFSKKIRVDFASTPFDIESVDYLSKIVVFFKISSSDITNFPLLKKVASKKKLIILSTGASSLKEIQEAVNFLRKNGCKSIVIMHCVLSYPTKENDANLGMILDLKNNFPNNVIGYSDHTFPKDMNNILYSYLLGARVIEKHFTLKKKKKGNDHYHSMDVKDLKKFIFLVKKSRLVLGSFKKKILKCEIKSRKYARRSLVLKINLPKGNKIREDHLICKRPGVGISPKYVNKVIGCTIKKNLLEDHILKWEDLKKN